MSKVIGFIVGAALVVVGILTSNPALIIQGGTMIVSNAIMLLTMPKQPARAASEMALQLGEQPRAVLFGETFTAGTLVDGFNYGGKYGTKFEVLVIRLADHRCDGLTGFYVNDEFYPYTGDGDVPGFDDGDDAALRIYYRSDCSNQPLPSVVTTYGPGWSAADLGRSGSDVVVVYEADTSKEKHPEWPGGRPRFGFVVKGKRCYDPRKDSTVAGGSGTHRWDNPSTWEWSDNPAVCRYNWVRGIYADDNVLDPTALLIGRGLTAEEAPPVNIFAAANLCDELVDGAKRYRVAGPVYSTQEFLAVEEMFAAATGGSIVTREGSVELEPGAAKSVVATFTDSDLIVGSPVSWNQGIMSEASGEWVNTVVARYVEPNQKWADHAAPVVRSTDDIIADGKPREASITLRLVRYSAQALRIAEITRRLGRLWGRATVTLGPRYCELEDGDWVSWQSNRRFGGATKTFRVEGYSINEKWHNTLTLREINAAVFSDGTLFNPDYSGGIVITPPPPDTSAPESGEWALVATTLTSSGASIPALVFSGACADPLATAVVFEYWKSDGVLNPVASPDSIPWVAGGTFGPDVTRCEITSLVGGATYYGAVTYDADGFAGERRVLGPVTVAQLDITGQLPIDTDGTLAANSDAKIPSQKAVKTYVDGKVAGLSWKQAVRAATTAPGTLATSFANGSTIDGVVLATGDRILIKNQAAASENGLYIVPASGAPTRATDADAGAELVNASCYVSEGTTNADTQWTCTTNAPVTLGTSAIAFSQFITSSYNDEAAQDAAAAALLAGTHRNAVITYDDAAGAISVEATDGGVTTQGGTSYTAALTDRNSYIRFTSGTAVTFTIPPNSSVPFPLGTTIEFEQGGAGALSVAAGAGVSINSRLNDLTLAGQYAVGFVKKVGTDTWTMNGDL